jgi:hypothetical protein
MLLIQELSLCRWVEKDTGQGVLREECYVHHALQRQRGSNAPERALLPLSATPKPVTMLESLLLFRQRLLPGFGVA